jgi:hypothetical protein
MGLGVSDAVHPKTGDRMKIVHLIDPQTGIKVNIPFDAEGLAGFQQAVSGIVIANEHDVPSRSKILIER